MERRHRGRHGQDAGSVRRVPELQRHAQERHREHAEALRPGGEQRGAGGGGRGGDGFAGHGDHEPIGGGDGRASKSTLIRLFTSFFCVGALLHFIEMLGAGLREDQVHARQGLEPGTPFANIVNIRPWSISSQVSSMLRVLRFKCAECRQMFSRSSHVADTRFAECLEIPDVIIIFRGVDLGIFTGSICRSFCQVRVIRCQAFEPKNVQRSETSVAKMLLLFT
mmetsp:Transcript_11509/g.46345  ORF Transcript_11509/g.46345 Transcript_11509/m.46345 type:complete len:223 (-) Transcript_11509:783-1451(-)